MSIRRCMSTAIAAVLACAALTPGVSSAYGNPFDRSFIGHFATFSTVGSTVPANGDLNPYGVVVVPATAGALVRGDVLVSNFNDSENLQGTGTTLVQLAPSGNLSLFAQIDPATLPGPCPGGVGLTTALAILPGGYVVVGSLPTANGKAATAQAGCLIVLDSSGHVVRTIAGEDINGPWDMTAVSAGPLTALFVTNVLNGTVASGEEPTDGGTVVRLVLFTPPGHAPTVLSERVVATGFPERTSEEALVVGPTGVGLGPFGTLYVADTQGNRIAAVPDALFRGTPVGGGGVTVAAGGLLNAPLGLAIAPNGDVLSTNGGDGNLVETTPRGAELRAFDTEAGAGGLFGLAVAPFGQGVYLVNDAENTLDLLH
jgi:hypothetical protein